MLLRRVHRERLIAQTRSDQNHEFAFRAATEQAQVKQDDLPSRNTHEWIWHIEYMSNYVAAV